jgi:integrase
MTEVLKYTPQAKDLVSDVSRAEVLPQVKRPRHTCFVGRTCTAWFAIAPRMPGDRTQICCHSFRATGITEYLRNGGKLEVAQQMANHESAHTAGLYDRRNDQISLDEVERILI